MATFALILLQGAGVAGAMSGLPEIHPVPQSLKRLQSADVLLGTTGTILAGPDVDGEALSVIRSTLSQHGVRVLAASSSRVIGSGLVVTVNAGGFRELNARDEAGIKAEGYALAIGLDSRKRPRIALAGSDRTGTFYGAQTLRDVLNVSTKSIPALEIRDWPSFTLRGVIEGFYGYPWSQSTRLDQLRFYGRHKLNTYVYSPKDDPYLRERWREGYPHRELERLKDLVSVANQNHVRFTYALSPGLSICYSSEPDIIALEQKIAMVWAIGVRSFSIPFDDLQQRSGCSDDVARFGEGATGGAAGQAYVLDRVQHDFIATHHGAARLQMVPEEYYGEAASPYRTSLASHLDPSILVGWTGRTVISEKITVQSARTVRAVFSHDLLLWDNYPVNDYRTDRLQLAPYVGRESGLSAVVAGITLNPMPQASASKIAIGTAADYLWNDHAYDPTNAWRATMNEYAGYDRDLETALAAFADLNFESFLDGRPAPALTMLCDDYLAGRPNSLNPLRFRLETIRYAPMTLQRLPDSGFVSDAEPWLAAASAWASADLAAVDALEDARAERLDAAAADRTRIVDAVRTAIRPHEYHGLRAVVQVHVGEHAMDRFVDMVCQELDRRLAPEIAASTPASGQICGVPTK